MKETFREDYVERNFKKELHWKKLYEKVTLKETLKKGLNWRELLRNDYIERNFKKTLNWKKLEERIKLKETIKKRLHWKKLLRKDYIELYCIHYIRRTSVYHELALELDLQNILIGYSPTG